MADAGSPEYGREQIDFINDELQRIRQLVVKATGEIKHGHLSEAREALRAGRHTYDPLSERISRLSPTLVAEQLVLDLRLQQAHYALKNGERQLAQATKMIAGDG